MQYRIFFENFIALILTSSLAVLYIVHASVYVKVGQWPVFGNPKSWEIIPLWEHTFLLLFTIFCLIVAVIGFQYCLINLIYNFFYKKRGNLKYFNMLLLTFFYISDPFGVLEWLVD